MATRNKFPGKCNNPACPLGLNSYNAVDTGAGYITQINGRWVTWCKECVPVQKSTIPARRILTADGKIFTPYEPENLPLIKSLRGPGGSPWPKFYSKTAGGPCWGVSLEQADRQRLLEVADRLKLEVPPQLLENNLLTAQAHNATAVGLYNFQVTGVNWLSKQKHALLADEMGLGKTIQALVAAEANAKLLVVVPANVKYNWRQEAAKWRPDLKVSILNGRGSFRFPQAGELIITNYEILADFLDPTPKVKGQKKVAKMKWPALKAWREVLKNAHPDSRGVTVIFDEIHKCKNWKAALSRKVRELSRLCSKTWGLTGTPLDNKASDLYGILDSMDMAFEVFTPSLTAKAPFKRFQELFHAQSNGYGMEYGTPDPIVPELLRRVMLRRRRAEVLPDLPRKTYTNLVVGPPNAELKRRLDEMWEKEGAALTLGGTLPSFEKISETLAALAKSNIPAMLEYVEEAEEQEVPLVVASAHLAPIDALLGRPGWAVITGATSPQKRQEIVNAFQAGHLKGIGVTIRAGGVGTNLTHAWKVLFVDQDWVPGWNAQMEDRVARIGQVSNKIEIIRMVNDHPLTLHVLNTLAKKIALIEAAVEKAYQVTPPVVKKDGGETETEYRARMAVIQKVQTELALGDPADFALFGL